jgi:hypothetical protein
MSFGSRNHHFSIPTDIEVHRLRGSNARKPFDYDRRNKMKKFITVMLIVSASAVSAFAGASDCKPQAKAIAQTNLDQVANAYGFDKADINEPAFVKTIKVPAGRYHPELEERGVYDIEGSIFKGAYDVRVTVDGLCAARSVTVTDISAE